MNLRERLARLEQQAAQRRAVAEHRVTVMLVDDDGNVYPDPWTTPWTEELTRRWEDSQRRA